MKASRLPQTPRRVAAIVALAAGVVGLTSASHAADGRQYTFSWMFTDESAMSPRGGTTRGTAVELAPAPSDAYLRLTGADADLSPLERDRLAILAMAGGYRTSFDFIETVGFTPGYQPSRPYQSWGTEYVYVVADEPRFISLQHILVMQMAAAEGEDPVPVVVKHWRQDWRHQDTDLHVYRGHDTWSRQTLDADQVAGAWSQAVFQVDDSPRYEAVGRWVHHDNHSTWTSSDTWRPLPRREFSVRDDYQVLTGSNRVTITPQGWVHEEDNLKTVLDESGRPVDGTPHLAREAGLNRYEHIVGFDFGAGDAYWQATGPFWAGVRDAWAEVLRQHDRFTLRPEVDGQPLFQAMFSQADAFAAAGVPADDSVRQAAATLEQYIE